MTYIHPDLIRATEHEIKKRVLQLLAEEQSADDLQHHLNYQCCKGWLSRDEFRLYEDAAFPPPEFVPSPERAQKWIDIAWQRYRDAIKRHGNPPDQIERFHQAGIILQDVQLQFSAWARRADDPYDVNEIGLGGARGGSKSFGIFAQITIDDCQRFPGLNVLYLRKAHNKGQEQMMDLISSVLRRTDHKFRERMSPQLIFPNGSAVRVGHYKNETEALNYQGLQYDDVVIEEATHLSLDAFKTLRNSTRSSKKWRPRVYVSTNPLGTGHLWFKKRFVDPEKHDIPFDEREHKTKFIFATVEDNKHLDEEYVDNLEDLTGAKLQAFRYGNWDVSAGAYFSTWDSAYHVVENISEFDDSWTLWTSKDYGFAHWDMWYLLGQQGEFIYLLYELAHRQMGVAAIAEGYHNMLKTLKIAPVSIRYNVVGHDAFRMAGHAEQTVAQNYAEHGIYLSPADNASGSRIAGAHHILQLLGDPARKEKPLPNRLRVCKRCERFIDTFPYLEHDPHNPEDVLKVSPDEDGMGGDDAYDAARYGLYVPHASSGTVGGR